MQAAELHQQLGLEVSRLSSVRADSLACAVPHLDGWTVQSVLGHTGWVCRYVVNSLESSPDNPPSRSSVGEPPVGDDVIRWCVEGADAAMAALKSVELDSVRPTWTGPQPAFWWLRRLTHELTIHRWDSYSATTTTSPDPINSRLAVDGIDEVLEVFVPNRLQFDVLDAAGHSLHLHATDFDGGEWMINIGANEISWDHSHGKGDVAARGPVSDLLLLMWGRIPPAAVEVFGDEDLLGRWQTAARF